MTALEGVRLALMVIHILGIGLVIGPAVAALRRAGGPDLRLMLTGAASQLVTGIALVVVRRAVELSVLGRKIGVKVAVALVILVVVTVGLVLQRRSAALGADAPGGTLRVLALGAAIAAAGNVVIAVVWR